MNGNATVCLVSAMAAIALLLAPAAARAEEPAADPNVRDRAPGNGKAADDQIEDIDQRLKVLERRKEIEQEQAAEKARQTVTATAGKDGFTLKSADGAFSLRVRGYVQADGRNWAGDVQNPAASTFLIRRARPILEGTIYRYFDFRIMPDFGDGKTALQDAYMEARFLPWLRLRAGKYKPPVGLERLQSATDLLFAERALPTNLVPNRDVGFQFSGDFVDGSIAYALGVFNGVPDGGSADADTNDGKDSAARLFFLPFKKTGVVALQGLGVGVAASQGSQKGTRSASGLGAYKTAGQQTFFSYFADGTAAGTVVAEGTRTRLSPQGWYYWGRIGLMAEKVTSTQEVLLGAAAAKLVNRAWQVTGSFLLTDDKASYKGVSPRKAFDPEAGGWGAFELVARVNGLTVDDDTFPTFADPAKQAREARAWGAGLNWYMNKGVKMMFDWDHTSFKGGAAKGDREDEKVAFVRLQVSF